MAEGGASHGIPFIPQGCEWALPFANVPSDRPNEPPHIIYTRKGGEALCGVRFKRGWGRSANGHHFKCQECLAALQDREHVAEWYLAERSNVP